MRRNSRSNQRKEAAVVWHAGQERSAVWQHGAPKAKQRGMLGKQAPFISGEGSRGSARPYASDALAGRLCAAVAAGTVRNRMLSYPLLEAGTDEQLMPLQQHEAGVAAPRPAAREAWPLT